MTPMFILAICVAAPVAALALLTAVVKWRIEAALPAPGYFVDVPGARLHVFEKGSGPALLLIHGLAGNLWHFRYGVMDHLASQYRVIAVDRPGSGYSERTRDASAALYAQADVMAALIDALQLGRPVVAGHSLGGAIALALAQRHPGKVAALALIAPLTHAPRTMSAAFDGLMIKRNWMRHLIAWTVAVPMGIATSRKVFGLAFGPELAPRDYGTRAGGLLSMRPSHFVAAATDLDAAWQDIAEIQRRYGEVRLPVAVLYGRGDRILDPCEQGQALVDKLPAAHLELVDGGHMLPVTQARTTASFIGTFAQRGRT